MSSVVYLVTDLRDRFFSEPSYFYRWKNEPVDNLICSGTYQLNEYRQVAATAAGEIYLNCNLLFCRAKVWLTVLKMGASMVNQNSQEAEWILEQEVGIEKLSNSEVEASLHLKYAF